MPQISLTARPRPASSHLTPREEQAFRRWYGGHAATWGLDPNPDAPQHHYDYRAAYQNHDTPDEKGHWPSTWKKPGHPNLIVSGRDTRDGSPAMHPSHRATTPKTPPAGSDAAMAARYPDVATPGEPYTPVRGGKDQGPGSVAVGRAPRAPRDLQAPTRARGAGPRR